MLLGKRRSEEEGPRMEETERGIESEGLPNKPVFLGCPKFLAQFPTSFSTFSLDMSHNELQNAKEKCDLDRGIYV
jgi:hypothetical protein